MEFYCRVDYKGTVRQHSKDLRLTIKIFRVIHARSTYIYKYVPIIIPVLHLK